MGQRCGKSIAMVVVLCLVFGFGSIALGSEEDLRKELEILKQKIAELEAKLEQPKMETSSETEDGTKEKPSLADEMRPHLAEIRKEIEEKLGLEIHGGVVPFYQGATAGKINGKNINDPSGAGLGANLELTWKPGLPAFENGRFYMRAHYGDGYGADKKLGGKLFANLNTIADDSATEIAGDRLNLLEAYYAHEFFDGKLMLAVGKTEPLVFIDTNAFANDENSQFVGKPFVNNPILDSEDEYAPIMAASLSPIEGWTISAAGVSTSRPHAPGKQQKSVYDNIFDNPVVAGQLTYSPKFGDLQGNYSLYGWNALYDHPKLVGKGSEKGWGIGLSFDQQVTEK